MTLTRALQVFSLRKLQHSAQCTVDGLGPQRSSVMICLSWRVRYNWKSIRSDRVNGNPLSLNLALLTHKRTTGRKQAECFIEKKKNEATFSLCSVVWLKFFCLLLLLLFWRGDSSLETELMYFFCFSDPVWGSVGVRWNSGSRWQCHYFLVFKLAQ